VVVINNSTARRLFSGEYPVGKTISLREVFDPKESLEIIGVVRDAKYTDLREEMPAQLFLPLTQSTSPGIFVVLRSTVNPAALAVSLRQAIRQIDSQTSFAAIRTLEESVESTLVQERMMARLSALFGLVSLVLVCVGIYGVISYALSLRIKEIGIRIAVGASRAAVLGMVLREAAVLIGAGVALGLAAASATTRYLASLLYGLTPGDPATVMAMIAFLIAAGLFAAYVPAHRASRVNPVTALRLQ
jgi:ABC-type antimicrobial peptide transport system permease subunit